MVRPRGFLPATGQDLRQRPKALRRRGGASRIITGQGIGMANVSSTLVLGAGIPEPGSAEELKAFAQIQERLSPLAQRNISDPRVPQTVVVVPSLSLDREELA